MHAARRSRYCTSFCCCNCLAGSWSRLSTDATAPRLEQQCLLESASAMPISSPPSAVPHTCCCPNTTDRLLQATQDSDTEPDQRLRLLASVLDQLPLPVLIMDAKLNLMFTNQMFHDVFRASKNEDNPLEKGVERAYHPDGRMLDLCEWPIPRALATGQPVIDDLVTLLLLRMPRTPAHMQDIEHKDGRRRIFRMNAAPVRNSAGRIIAATWSVGVSP